MILELATYFTGPAVTAHSMGLGMSGYNKITAEAFFKAREACGIRGYASPDEAVSALSASLKTDGTK